MNGHTIGFHPQTQKLELPQGVSLNVRTMGFHLETEALELHTKEISTRESTAEETPFELWSLSEISIKNFSAHSLSVTIFNVAQRPYLDSVLADVELPRKFFPYLDSWESFFFKRLL